MPTSRLTIPLLVAVLAVTLFAGRTTSAASPSVRLQPTAAVVTQPRQMWVWHFTDPGSLVRLARTAHVTELLVWAGPGFSSDPSQLRRLRALQRAAAAAHVQVQALCGDTSWVGRPDVVSRWVDEVASVGLFSGVHLDIEPQSMPDWSTDEPTLARGLLSALDAASSAGLPVEADIPAWFDRVSVDGVRLDTAVLTRTSGITVMAYQNTAAGVLAAARPEVLEAGRLHKYAFIGVNLAPTGGDAPTTTMMGEPASTIAANVHDITTAGPGLPGFRGVALHDSEYVAKLKAAATGM